MSVEHIYVLDWARDLYVGRVRLAFHNLVKVLVAMVVRLGGGDRDSCCEQRRRNLHRWSLVFSIVRCV